MPKTFEKLRDELYTALTEKIKEVEGVGKDPGVSIFATFDDTVIFQIWDGDGTESEMAGKHFQANWKDAGEEGVEVSRVIEVEPQYPTKGKVLAESGTSAPAEPEATDQHGIPLLVESSMEKGVLEFWGQLELESRGKRSPEISPSGHKIVRGRIPIMRFGVPTSNGNIYTDECWRWLQIDSKRVLESKASGQLLEFQGSFGGDNRSTAQAVNELMNLGPGAMFLTHRAALDPAQFNPMLEIGAKVTHFSREGDLGYAHFRTVDTQRGDTTAGLLVEGFIRGGSLRAMPRDDGGRQWWKDNNHGGKTVERLNFMGVDFTNAPATNLPEGVASLVLEADGGGGGWEEMTLEELKKLKSENPEEYKRVLALMKEDLTPDIRKALEAEGQTEDQKKALEQAKTDKETAEKQAEELQAKLTEREKAEKGAQILDGATKEIGEDLKKLGEKAGEAATGEISAAAQKLIDASKTPAEVEEKAKELVTEAQNIVKKYTGLVLEARGLKMKDGENTIPGSAARIGDGVNINSLGPQDNMRGMLCEAAGSPNASMSDGIAALMLESRVYDSDGHSIFDRFEPFLSRAIRKQNEYLLATQRGLMGAFQGLNDGQREMVSEARSQVADGSSGEFLNRLVLEADEQTTTTTFGSDTPAHAISSALIKAQMPALILLQIAKPGIMAKSSVDFYEEISRRADQHYFGTITYGGSWDEADGDYTDTGPVDIPTGEVYVQVITAVDTATTFTITGTNQSAVTTATLTCYVKTTDLAGTILKARPTTDGDRFYDITGLAASGYTSAGKVAIFIPAYESAATGGSPLIYETEGSAYQKLRTSWRMFTATAEDHALGAHISMKDIEDMSMALQPGGSNLDTIANLGALIMGDMGQYIDGKAFWAINALAISTTTTYEEKLGYSNTFSQTVPAGSGKTEPEYLAELDKYVGQMVDHVAYISNVQPNWIVINRTDRAKFADWVGDKILKYNPGRRQAFDATLSIGQWHGCEVHVNSNATKNSIICGSNQRGLRYDVLVPYQLYGPTWIPGETNMGILRRQRSVTTITQPHTLGNLRITA